MLGSMGAEWRVAALAAARKRLTGYVVETHQDMVKLLQWLEQRTTGDKECDLICAETVLKRAAVLGNLEEREKAICNPRG